MIPIARLYAIIGVTMVALLTSMVLDEVIPTFTSAWLAGLAHPLIATLGIAVCATLIFERSLTQGSYAFFIAAIIALFTVLLNSALVSMVGAGSIPIALSVLASLSIRIPLAWIIIGISGIAMVLAGSILVSSLLVSIIIGAAPTLLIERWNDA